MALTTFEAPRTVGAPATAEGAAADSAAAARLAESLLGGGAASAEESAEEADVIDDPATLAGQEVGDAAPGLGAEESDDADADAEGDAPEDAEHGEPVGQEERREAAAVIAEPYIDADSRRRLIEAEEVCDLLESQINGLKEKLKGLREEFAGAVSSLRKIVRGLKRDSDRPLLAYAERTQTSPPPAADAACEEPDESAEAAQPSQEGAGAADRGRPPASCRHLWAREKFPTRVELLHDLGPFDFTDHPEPVSLLAGTTHDCSVSWLTPEEAESGEWEPRLLVYGGLVELEHGPAAAGEYQVIEWAEVPLRTEPPSPETEADEHAAAMQVPLASLVEFGLTEKMVESLAEHSPSLTTLGGLVDYQEAGGRLSDVKGFGEKRLDKLADAMEAFWAAWNQGRRQFGA